MMTKARLLTRLRRLMHPSCLLQDEFLISKTDVEKCKLQQLMVSDWDVFKEEYFDWARKEVEILVDILGKDYKE